MTALPGPDATRAEVEAWEERATIEANARLRAELPRKPRTCSSCGEVGGHRRGDRACPNYDSPVRWQAHGKPWVRP